MESVAVLDSKFHDLPPPCPRSEEWGKIPQREKDKLGLKVEDDGEFWFVGTGDRVGVVRGNRGWGGCSLWGWGGRGLWGRGGCGPWEQGIGWVWSVGTGDGVGVVFAKFHRMYAEHHVTKKERKKKDNDFVALRCIVLCNDTCRLQVYTHTLENEWLSWFWLL